jgi:hypothetical protein
MRIQPSGHDPRQIDLLAVVAILLVIIAAGEFLTGHPKVHLTSSFIVPSQTVRW